MQCIMLRQVRFRQTVVEVLASVPVRMRTLQTRPRLPLLLVATGIWRLVVFVITVRDRSLRNDQPRCDRQLPARWCEFARITGSESARESASVSV